MNKIAFCVTGWHFPQAFYQSLAGLSEIDVYIVSHKKGRFIPNFLGEIFDKEQILIRSNIGYDWGCYQQFLNSDLWIMLAASLALALFVFFKLQLSRIWGFIYLTAYVVYIFAMLN